MQQLILRYVFVPEPGPSVVAQWAARIMFPRHRKTGALRLPNLEKVSSLRVEG